MKKVILMLLLITTTAILANAQDTTKVKKTPEERAAQLGKTLQKKLHLTADQATKVNAILVDRADKLAAMQGQKVPKGQRAQVMADGDTQIEALLTDAQKKLYIEMRAYNKEKMMAQKGKPIPAAPAAGSPR